MEKCFLYEIKQKYVGWLKAWHYSYVAILIGTMLGMIPAFFHYHNFFLYYLLSVLVIGFLFLVIILYFVRKNYQATSYRIYNDKVEFAEGFINYKFTSVKFKDIKEIHMTQGILQRLAGVGSVVIYTSSNTGYQNTGVRMIDIENVSNTYKILKQLYEQECSAEI